MDYDDDDDDLLDLNKDNFPYMDVEPVLDFMRTLHPYEIATFASEDGYDCSNMRRPEEALEWMNFARAEGSEWRDLPVGAVRFWKAFYQKWRIWQMSGGPR